MTKFACLLLCILLLSLAVFLSAENISVTGKVIDIEKYGHAKLDITIAAFKAAGFDLGDIVTVKAGSYEGDMPCYDGYYVHFGEYMVRAMQDKGTIAVCINYGNFAETAGIDVGDEVTILLKEKAGALATQQIDSLVYTNDRADYSSDEIFANFRAVHAGSIGEGKLYRSASPVLRKYGRRSYVNRLIEKVGIKAVMNMANTDEEILAYAAQEDFDSAYYMNLYENGHVIPLSMALNFSSDDFAEGIVKGLTFLSTQEPPFLVHCNEGKDRAGFGCMIPGSADGSV